MLRRKECRDSTSTPPLRSNLSFTRRRVILAQKHRQRHGSFSREHVCAIEEKRRVANPEHARPEIPSKIFESGSAETCSTRIFSTAFTSSSSGRHLGSQTALPTVARCTVAMWTDGRSARPLTWARRTRVRVFARTHATPYASTPRLPESAPSAPLTRRHSACRDPGSDADPLPPPRADQGGNVRRVVCTGHTGEGCRTLLVYPQVRARRGRARSRNVSQKRVVRLRCRPKAAATVVFSTTAFIIRVFLAVAPGDVAVETPTTRRHAI